MTAIPALKFTRLFHIRDFIQKRNKLLIYQNRPADTTRSPTR